MWGDEMRVGLRGQVRKVWAPRGMAVSQEVPIGWSYLFVAVALDPRTGRLWWAWQKNMKGAEMVRIWGAWAEEPDIDGWVWDGAGGHRSTDMQAVDAPRVVQPSYAPELNPVERLLPGVAAGPRGPRLPDPAGPAGSPGADPEGLADRPGTGTAAVRLGLDPGSPRSFARHP